jgi:nitronate monooxygenase
MAQRADFRSDNGSMPLRTAFTELFSLQHPIALAPMGGMSGGALAAAVSNGGGLGIIGGGREDPDWLERELQIVTSSTTGPWGVGFQSWATDAATVERALAYRPGAVMLSFGDPRPLVEPVRRAGAMLIVQVTDLDEARQALEVGADVIVAQGTEAGGHGGRRSTLPFVPVVVDLAAPAPVLAAGGIADGRGVAAALALGAAGALLGTRFLVCGEALAPAYVAKAIIDGSGEDTERSRISDIARGAPWPPKWAARTLRNRIYDQWRGREQEFAADPAARQAYNDAVSAGELTPGPVWASEAIDLITELDEPADLVARLAADAEQALARALTR